MFCIEARNVHQALPKAIDYLKSVGVARDSRNGPVLQAPTPVTTVYYRPAERLPLWEERDANVAFLVAEALWMLAGRDDLEFLTRYVSDFGQYSDNGKTLHGAYGHRWRQRFGLDQLRPIATHLRRAPEDRRNVLQMWSAELDLQAPGKDVPCNTMATVQLNTRRELELCVFNRSNDILWGCYFANAYHFGVLAEYLAGWIGVPLGPYRQISVNWHAYTKVFDGMAGLAAHAQGWYATPYTIPDPYADGAVRHTPLLGELTGPDGIEYWDILNEELLMHVETGFALPVSPRHKPEFFEVAYAVLRAHHIWRTQTAPLRFDNALAALAAVDPQVDLVFGMRRWLQRRQTRWQAKQEVA